MVDRELLCNAVSVFGRALSETATGGGTNWPFVFLKVNLKAHDLTYTCTATDANTHVYIQMIYDKYTKLYQATYARHIHIIHTICICVYIHTYILATSIKVITCVYLKLDLVCVTCNLLGSQFFYSIFLCHITILNVIVFASTTTTGHKSCITKTNNNKRLIIIYI